MERSPVCPVFTPAARRRSASCPGRLVAETVAVVERRLPAVDTAVIRRRLLD